jgi:hypothetical protein
MPPMEYTDEKELEVAEQHLKLNWGKVILNLTKI